MGKGLFGRLQSELDAREESPGITMADILTMPDDLRTLVNWMIRRGQVTFAEVCAFLTQDETATRQVIKQLLEKHYAIEFELHGETMYRVRLAPKRRREVPLNVWQALDDKTES